MVFLVEEFIPTFGSKCHDVNNTKPNANGRNIRIEGLEADPGGFAYDPAHGDNPQECGGDTASHH